jgi:hypothetical protein
MATLSLHHATTGSLSCDEEAALRALHDGRRGIDVHSERRLIRRGLVALSDWRVGMLVFHDMPFLTDRGTDIAAQLVAERELANDLCRLHGAFSVVQGGVA